jgi:hypothetical protein
MHFNAIVHRAHMLTETTADTPFPVDVRHPIRLLIDGHVSAISACNIAEVASDTELFPDMTPDLSPLEIVMHHDIGRALPTRTAGEENPISSR